MTKRTDEREVMAWIVLWGEKISEISLAKRNADLCARYDRKHGIKSKVVPATITYKLPINRPKE